jgi:FkbM family methyltransferase
MIELIAELLKTFDSPIHFVELGVNDGYHTAILAQMLAHTGLPWRYLAVEPDPRLALAIPPGVDVFRGAVGAEDGRAELHLSSGQSETGMHYSGSSSLRAPTELMFRTWPKMRFDEKVIVDVLTLDTLCERFKLDWIDFIWCDVQGCECDVIRGGKRMMPRTKWFFTEYTLGQLYDGQAVFSDFAGLMPDFNLHTDFHGDVLFVNKAVNLTSPGPR